jgi:hypothetical protein
LERHALPESIHLQRIFVCSKCGATFTDEQVTQRQKLGFTWIRCSVCDTQTQLLDLEELFTERSQSIVSAMDNAADLQREHEVLASVLQGKKAVDDFDVFLCYNNIDRLEVEKIAEQLREQGILPWFDVWNLAPGQQRLQLLEQQLAKMKSAAVFVGASGMGPWHQMEVDAMLRQFLKRGCPVIPVLLKDANETPPIPIFLEGMEMVDFRQQKPDPVARLIWGITGKRMGRNQLGQIGIGQISSDKS